MGIVAKYKFNQTIYENFIPEFNADFTVYTVTDEIDTDSYTIRTIESDSLPTLIRFGATTETDREKSLLEVYECNTENVTAMNSMFNNCSSLTSLDVSNFNTSQVTNMNSMFNKCSSLTLLDVSNFNTSQVTAMNSMFAYCSSLTSLDVSNFNTSQVTDMGGIFCDCASLDLLDVSNFNTGQVTSMSNMFKNCSSLTSLDVSNFNTENVTNMQQMFDSCSSLTSLDVSNFNTENVTTMFYMFYDCSSLTSLDISNFNTEKVTNMQSMFYNCSKLTSLDVSNFNTEKVTNIAWMFYGCSLLTFLDVSNFNTENVTSMEQLFNNCNNLTSLDVSNFDTSQAKNMSYLFQGCSKLISIDVSNWNTDRVTDMTAIFNGCSSLISLDLSSFNTKNVTNMRHIFNNCSSLISLDISSFNMENVTNTERMFTNCNITDIGTIYCDSDTINKISDLITTDTTIWYMDSKLEDLTEKENITYKEYKMNILESDEEIVLRRVGDVYDELNLETSKLTQRIGEIVLDGSENWEIGNDETNPDNYTNSYRTFFTVSRKIVDIPSNCQLYSDKYKTYTRNPNDITEKDFIFVGNYNLNVVESANMTVDEFRNKISLNPITVQYQLATELVKTINLKGKPSINWQGDTYLHLENNTLYPQLDCEIESINYYEIPKLKANTLYTLRYVGEPTQCIFGGLTYETENNMILTSGSSDNLLYFDKEVRKVILIEGDVRDRNFDYFEGIESLGAVEIVTHKSDMPIFAKGGRK